MSASRSLKRRARLVAPLRDFLRAETSGGVILLGATIVALLWANSPFGELYDDLWHGDLRLGIGTFGLTETFQHWINDGLMTIFFFVVGLEIKRELVTGELRDPRNASLPVIAAMGGMIAPAVVYILVNTGGVGSHGWGIPMATDIAFAVGVLAALGRRVPTGLKLFLLTLAIVDDIGAIVVIAIFYSSGLSWGWLGIAFAALGAVAIFRWTGVSRPILYVPVGAVAWLAAFESGIHPTIAGVAIALITPAHPVHGRTVLLDLEHRLHPVSSYFIVPLFALANAGVVFHPEAIDNAVRSPVFLGVTLGLVVGKTLGVGAAAFASVRLRISRLPSGVHWRHIAGASALAGIGFTVSLFITSLAFRGEEITDFAKMGVLAGSALSALIGIVVLSRAGPTRRGATAEASQPVG